MILCASGCASVVDGTKQSVSVKTSPVSEAHCSLHNDEGNWFISETPKLLVVKRSYQPLKIRCEKEDGWYGSTEIESKTKGLAYGNVLAGGLIGAAVDVGNGAAYDYPTEITVQMTQDGSADPLDPASLSPAPVY